MSKAEAPRKPVIIIPASPRRTSRQVQAKDKPRRRGPRPLVLLLIALVLIALAHLLVVTHQPSSSTVVDTSSCAGLVRTADYTQQVHLQADSEQLAAVEIASQLDGGQPASLVQVYFMCRYARTASANKRLLDKVQIPSYTCHTFQFPRVTQGKHAFIFYVNRAWAGTAPAPYGPGRACSL